MTGLLLEINFGSAVSALTWIVIVLGVIVGLAELFASVANSIYNFKFMRGYFKKLEAKYSASEAVRIFLDSNGLQDVKVEKAGFWRFLFLGQGYSPRRNTIFLRKMALNSTNLTFVATAISFVGKAVEYRNGDNRTKRLIKATSWLGTLPYLVVPFVLLGIIIDAVAFKFEYGPMFTLLTSSIGLLFFILVSIFMFMLIGIEKKANDRAYDMMEKSNFLNENELKRVKSLYNWRIVVLIANFIISLIEVVRLILKIIVSILKMKKK